MAGVSAMWRDCAINHAVPRVEMNRWLPPAVLGVLALSLYFSGVHRYLTVETLVLSKSGLESYVAQHRVLSVLLYVLAYIAIVALSIPGALLMTLLGGLLFGFWVGTTATVTGAAVGATLLFMVAGSSVGAALRSRGGAAVQRMAEGLRRDAASYMLFLRLVPVFPFALVNLAPAIVGVPLTTFVWTTLLGILPGTMAFTLAATSLGGVLDDKRAAYEACKTLGQPDCRVSLDVSTLVNPKLLLAFAALGVVALIPVVARRFWATDRT
jgi:uncharacterized membrane protein YdjX (TVP38/TMEM64 family)